VQEGATICPVICTCIVSLECKAYALDEMRSKTSAFSCVTRIFLMSFPLLKTTGIPNFNARRVFLIRELEIHLALAGTVISPLNPQLTIILQPREIDLSVFTNDAAVSIIFILSDVCYGGTKWHGFAIGKHVYKTKCFMNIDSIFIKGARRKTILFAAWQQGIIRS
jgi:hypothetical protein